MMDLQSKNKKSISSEIQSSEKNLEILKRMDFVEKLKKEEKIENGFFFFKKEQDPKEKRNKEKELMKKAATELINYINCSSSFWYRLQSSNIPERYFFVQPDKDFFQKHNYNPFNWAFVYGFPGMGKTHLICSAVKLIIESDLLEQYKMKEEIKSKVAYFSFPNLLLLIRDLFNPKRSNDKIEEYNKKFLTGCSDPPTPFQVEKYFPFKTEVEVLEWFNQLDYLFLDDLGLEKISPFAEELLFLIINNRYNLGKHCCVCSNFSSFENSDIRKLGYSNPVLSRVICGQIIYFDLKENNG